MKKLNRKLALFMSMLMLAIEIMQPLQVSAAQPELTVSGDEATGDEGSEPDEPEAAVSEDETAEAEDTVSGDETADAVSEDEAAETVDTSEDEETPVVVDEDIDEEQDDAAADDWYTFYDYTIVSNELHLLKSKGTFAENLITKAVIPATVTIDGTTYDVVLDAAGQRNNQRSLWAPDAATITSIVIEDGVKTVSDISYLFYNLSSVSKLDVSGLDTSNVTSMSYTFAGLSVLTDLNMTGLDTSSVKDMSYMFFFSKKLKNLDLSGFDTSQVTNMASMFQGCESVKELDLGSFNTANVLSMQYMFNSCKALEYVNVASFDTSKVTNMGRMFTDCSRLMELDLRNFNTANVTVEGSYTTTSGFGGMFENLSPYITSLDLRSFNFSKGTNSTYVFSGTSIIDLYLPVIALKGYNFSEMTNLARIYYAGDEDQWNSLGNSVPSSVEVIFTYTDPEPEKTPYTVTLDPNGGTCAKESILVTEGKNYGTLPVPTRAGYQFEGWFTEKTGGEQVKFNTVVTKTSAHTLYAHWSGSGDVAVTGVSVSPDSVELTVGETKALTATVSPAEATDKSVSWNSSKPEVATVDESGVITAVAAGEATITVKTTDGNYTATCAVKVNAAVVSVTGVSVSPNAVKLKVGETKALTVTVSPADASDKSVSYNSSNESVATVSTSGVITAVASGNAVITVTTTDGGKTDTCEVTVYEESTEPATISVNSVSLSPKTLSLKEGETGTLTATVLPADATDKSVTFSSSNTEVATVNETGLVTAVASGNAVITVTTTDGGKTDTCEVTVTAKEAAPVSDKCVVEFYWDNDDDVTELLATVTVAKGDAVDFPDAPEKAGYVFAGWLVDGEEGSNWDETAPVLRDMDLHARFISEEGASDGRHSGLDPDLVIEDEIELYMVKGQKYNFPSDQTWESSDKSVVTITKGYKSAAKKAGRTIITGTASDGTSIKYVTYVTDPKLAIELPEAQKGAKSLSIIEGNTAKLTLDGMIVERAEVDDDGTVSVLDKIDATEEYDITWITSNKEVAKVMDDGVVYAVSKGTAKITAYICGKAYNFNVKVTDIHGVSEYAGSIELSALQTVNVKYKKSDFKLSSKTTWSSTDGSLTLNGKFYQNKVVRISAGGKLTAIGVGQTTLIAKNPGSDVEKTFTVVVNDPAAKTLYINKGKSKTVKIRGVKFTGATAAVVSVPAEYAKIVGANKNKITGTTVGKAKVYYHCDPYGTGGFDYTVNVYVEDPVLVMGSKLKHKSGSKYTLELTEGESFVLQMLDVYQSPVYSSSKKDVAIVDEMGVITAKSAGSKGRAKSTISAKINGVKISIELTVTK